MWCAIVRALFPALLLLIVTLDVGHAIERSGSRNLFGNGDMEADADQNGIPDGWHGGHADVGTGIGRNGGKALTITGPDMPVHKAFRGASTSNYELAKGRAYRLSWWWKCPDRPGRPCFVTLRTGSPIRPTTGKRGPSIRKIYAAPSAEWSQETYCFPALADAKRSASELAVKDAWFFIGVSFPGTVYVDDVKLEHIPVEDLPSVYKIELNPLRRRLNRSYLNGPIWPQKAEGNLVPNASFELGKRAWASWIPDTPGTNSLNGQPYWLMGDIDGTQAKHGRHSLRIQLDGHNLPDCLNPETGNRGMPATELFAATFGLIPVQDKHRYVLSAWLKAAAPGTVAVLSLTGPRGGGMTNPPEKRFLVSTEWQRRSLAFEFSSPDGFLIPLVGLKWRRNGANPCTLWIDAVQLEKVAAISSGPTDFHAREETQASVDTDKLGNICEKGESLKIALHAFNDAPVAKKLSGKLTVTDYWDRQVFEREESFSLQPRDGETRTVLTRLKRAGFYRVRFLEGRENEPSSTQQYDLFPVFANFQDLRAAIIKPYSREEHPGLPRTGWEYPLAWEEVWRTLGRAGIGITKCIVKWDTIEPWEGHTDYSAYDELFKNLNDAGIEVLGGAPAQTSCGWNSVTPYDLSGCYEPDHWRGYRHGPPERRLWPPNTLIHSVRRPGGGWGVEIDTSDRTEQDTWRLEQRDSLQLEVRRRYRISFFARSSGATRRSARVVLVSYPDLAPAGLDQAFVPCPDHSGVRVWKRYQFDFVCSASTRLGSSLQFYLEGPGALGLDDVSLREVISGDKLGQELVENGGFENRTLRPSSAHAAAWGKRILWLNVPDHGNWSPPPVDMDQLRQYWTRTASRFRGRVRYWEFFHENYFPTQEDKRQYMKAVYEGIKSADPDAQVLCGAATSFVRGGAFGQMWREGINQYFDGTTSSGYEGTVDPDALGRYISDMQEWMQRSGGAKPMYCTEGWRYADDDPTDEPWAYGGTKGPFQNEKEYGDYSVRYGTALFGNGVKFVMYMPFSSLEGVELPRSLHWLEYGLVPRKVYAAQAGFAHIVTPDAEIHTKEHPDDGNICVYVFKRSQDAVAVVWALRRPYRVDKRGFRDVEALDIFGEPIDGSIVSITRSPVYLVGDSAEALLRAAAWLNSAEPVTAGAE